MALFNKLFSSRKKNYNKYQDNVCDKLFAFTNDQVRVVLFRECDFRGRKLLFDSHTAQKVPLINHSQHGHQNAANATNETQKKTANYIEISNGYGYLYTKPNSDISQLGEMIFGSVAMSYRGTSYKIHNLASPSRLMCTQVFQSPRYPNRGARSSAPSRTCTHSSAVSSQSLDHSFKLEDSSTSCTSFSDQSVQSTASDTLLVCRKNRSVPLDVPQTSNSGFASSIPNSSLVGDSGFCGEQSYSSTSSGPQSVPTWDANKIGNISFSCGSLYKKLLRNASTSLEYSASSLTGSSSTDECSSKPHPRPSKLGIAVVIQLTNGQEERLEQFLMDHAALIEVMVRRARQGAETAYIRHNNFVSLMVEVAVNTSNWLVDLLSGPKLSTHLWLTLYKTCDSSYSININDKAVSVKDEHFEQVGSVSNSDLTKTSLSSNLRNTKSDVNVIDSSFKSNSTSSYESTNSIDKGSDFIFLNITKFFKNDWDSIGMKKGYSCSDKNFVAEKFVNEFCELLESTDVKQTNFFVSTLVTAVLTHHLGWVATALSPSKDDKEVITKLQKTSNPLWGQLNDLYGAVGHPTKVAHTVITGSNKSELITKILNSLTYFIRCSDIERKCVARIDTALENLQVDRICKDNACIPKAYYKKYEDHLKEIAAVNSSTNSFNGKNVNDKRLFDNLEPSTADKLSDAIKFSDLKLKDELFDLTTIKSNSKGGLSRAHTCMTNLNKLVEENDKIYPGLNNNDRLYPSLDEFDVISEELKTKSSHEIMDKITSLGLQAIHSPPLKNEKQFDFSSEEIKKKVNTLCRVPKSAVLYHLDTSEKDSLVTISEAKEQVQKVFCPKKMESEKQRTSDLISFYDDTADEYDTTTTSDNATPDDRSSGEDSRKNSEGVVFVLGENEKLVGLKKENSKCQLSLVSLQESDQNLCSKTEKEKTSMNYTLKKNGRVPFPNNLSFTSCNLEMCKPQLESESIQASCSNIYTRKIERPSSLNIPETKKTFYCESSDSSTEDIASVKITLDSSSFKDSDFIKYEGGHGVKPSASWTQLNLLRNKRISSENCEGATCSASHISDTRKDKEFSRSQSVPPEGGDKSNAKTDSTPRYRYTGVKFNFQQHPQIFKNYMKSKNIELSNLSFSEKSMKFNTLSPNFDFSNSQGVFQEVEGLQTPSNASELEYTSELIVEKQDVHNAKEVTDVPPKTFIRNVLPNTVIRQPNLEDISCENSSSILMENQVMKTKSPKPVDRRENSFTKKMRIVELPMPKSSYLNPSFLPVGYTCSLFRGLGERYTSDMVLQGTSSPKSQWETSLRKDLTLAARHSLLDQPVEEAVAIIANTDTWDVQLMSSHTYVVDKGSSGIRVGMSQLVANMLESLLHMWKLHTPPEYCLMHIEERLQEFCIRSKALAHLLLDTDFCSMELLTSVLQLEVNDVPLLMAVASTHSPQITQKYGLSFQ